MPPECEGSPGAVACRARDGRIDSRQLHPASNSLDELLPPALRVVIRHALPTLAAALCAALGACGPGRVPAWHEEAGYRWRELRVRGGRPGFTRMETARTGIAFQNTVSDSALLGKPILGPGAGVCPGDAGGDGRNDILLARTEGANALYRNLGAREEDV